MAGRVGGRLGGSADPRAGTASGHLRVSSPRASPPRGEATSPRGVRLREDSARRARRSVCSPRRSPRHPARELAAASGTKATCSESIRRVPRAHGAPPRRRRRSWLLPLRAEHVARPPLVPPVLVGNALPGKAAQRVAALTQRESLPVAGG